MLRFILLFFILITVLASYDGIAAKRRNNKNKFKLKVGKAEKVPEITNKEGRKESKGQPTTDVIPQSATQGEAIDHQKPSTANQSFEAGMPPKYPLKAMSAEVSAHNDEIGGCRDHPRASLVCQRCSNKCFPAEHEAYTYSYCRNSCHHCDPLTSSFHTFWRLRAENAFEPTWMVKELEFYASPQENITLVDVPQRAYASSQYAGFNASFAFDKNNATSWYPSGWGNHDNNDDWIAYEFAVAVRIHAIRMVLDGEHRTASPQKIVVEASDKKFGPFSKKWIMYNPTYEIDKAYELLECPVLWRKFEVDDGSWCYRQIAKFESWKGAKKICEMEGGQLASVLSKEEQRFITDDVQICGHTWIGLSHKEQAYYWDDGSNSTYRNWKTGWSYSDVQKQNLNCVAMDIEGSWYNFHCDNKYYFVCKQKLVPRDVPRPDLIMKAWPYDPETPPVIFISPNVTVPVINSRNLEPGVFPDANGNVEEEEEEEKSLPDLLYEQTVEHLKEKGLAPSEENENDAEQEETEFTQQLNKIAIESSSDDYKNETIADTSKSGSAEAHRQEDTMEKQEENQEEFKLKPNEAPSPQPNTQGNPVQPPPSGQPVGENNDGTLPKIVNGKPVQDSENNQQTVGGNKEAQPSQLPSQPATNAPTKNPTNPPQQPNQPSGSPQQPSKTQSQQSVATSEGGNSANITTQTQSTHTQDNGNTQQNQNQNNNTPQNSPTQKGRQSGTAPQPAQPTQRQTNNQTNWGNGAGLPPVMGGPPPAEIPEPPPTKEGDGNDDDSEESVGGQADQQPETNEQQNNSEEESDENENDDSNDEANDDSQKNVPEKPIQIKTSDGQDASPKANKETTVGRENDNKKKFIGKNKNQKSKVKGIHKLHHTEKKSKPANKRKGTSYIIKAPKRTEVAKFEESGSGSGDQGDDEELDDVLESTTNDLW